MQIVQKIYMFIQVGRNKYTVQRVRMAVEGGGLVIQLEGHDLSVDDMMGGIAV